MEGRNIRTSWSGRRWFARAAMRCCRSMSRKCAMRTGDKQDCEINAGKRMAKRLREEHRQLKICLTGDDLCMCALSEPFILNLRELRMDFVLVAKPSSHEELLDWVEDLDRLGECVKGKWEEGPACKRRYFEYRSR
ncbi:MAG: hypothetical protein KIT57_02590 [Blastocatellales bacterium]|nr:hypothetical protein [Blastocatellales bacterium]